MIWPSYQWVLWTFNDCIWPNSMALFILWAIFRFCTLICLMLSYYWKKKRKQASRFCQQLAESSGHETTDYKHKGWWIKSFNGPTLILSPKTGPGPEPLRAATVLHLGFFFPAYDELMSWPTSLITWSDLVPVEKSFDAGLVLSLGLV